MPRTFFCLLLLLTPPLLYLPAHAQLDKVFSRLGMRNGGALSATQIASGLKEALQIGTDRAVTLTSAPDGFFKNLAIKILMPRELRNLEKALRFAGMGAKVDEFERSMNRAAEQAAPAASAIFKQALLEMTIPDAQRILTGGDTAATQYFKERTAARLTAAFQPTVEAAMEQTGVVRQYKQLTAGLAALPLGRNAIPKFDLTGYVVGKTLDGLFHMIAQEEKRIRSDPAAQITPLLKQVFGKR